MFFPGNICALVTGESRDPQKVQEELLRAARKLVRSGEPENFGRIKRASYGLNLRSLDRFETLCREQTEGIMNDYDFLESLGEFEKISWNEIRDTISEIILGEQMSMSVVLPK